MCRTDNDIIKEQMTFYRFLLRKRIAAAKKTEAMMAQYPTREARERYQVEKFNAVWKTARENVPFYRKWQEKFGLPDEIRDLAELKDWPILTKADLRKLEDFIRTDIPYPSGLCLTGGSTGEPVRLPSWGDPMAGVSQMMGRAAYGIELGDRTFLLWGHEHLYGTGIKRKINAYKRRFKDWLAGWTRVSAYDLGADAMHCAYAKLVQVQPKFIIGFSPAVLAFVRQNAANAHKVASVRVILCTAGPLTSDEKQEIVDYFTPIPNPQSPIPKLCMEYGSVECGIMAYTRPSDGQYNVFWNTHLLQAKKENGEYKNLVTRLTDCYIPLIRYDIGDYLELDPEREAENERSVLEIKTVKGRPSEMLKFKCGVSFFGALIGDCVKQVPEVVSSQIAVNEDEDRLEIRVTANVALAQTSLGLIRNRFELTVANASKLTLKVVQVQKLFTTVGGKTPRVIRL